MALATPGPWPTVTAPSLTAEQLAALADQPVTWTDLIAVMREADDQQRQAVAGTSVLAVIMFAITTHLSSKKDREELAASLAVATSAELLVASGAIEQRRKQQYGGK